MQQLVVFAVCVSLVVGTIDKAADKGPKVTTQVGWYTMKDAHRHKDNLFS
jgi:hypothetical protein